MRIAVETPARSARVGMPWPVAAIVDAAVACGLLLVFLAAWRRDFHVPLTFSYDALEYLVQTKGTVENGWWWVHPRLSAPGTFSQLLYPSNTNVDQAIVRLASVFSSDAGLVINISWMAMVVLSAAIASRCFALLGATRRSAAAAAVLFAFSPYALARNIDHFALAIYLVPLPCAAALLVASGRMRRQTPSVQAALFAGCALVGFNYPYYAFFACFLIGVAALVAYLGDRDAPNAIRGAALMTVVCLATAVNLVPSMRAWEREGRPSVLPQKHAAEAETYGLKIRQLISPIPDHTVSPLRQWAALEKAAKFPLENENRNARLGVVAAIGFLALLAGMFVTRVSEAAADPPLFVNAARLTLAGVLLATVGGFGSLFSLLVTPDIRAYNRIAPFLAFYALLAIALLADRLLAGSTLRRRRWAVAGLTVFAAVGLYDDAQAVWPVNADHPGIAREWHSLSSFIHLLEAKLPQHAMVFELPVVTYQNETGRARMLPNDQLKPYVVSRHVRWSYPALADATVRWQLQVARLPPRRLAAAIKREGFAAILIDRFGFDDNGRALLAELGATTDGGGLLAGNDRYAAIDDGETAAVQRFGAAARPATDGVPRCAQAAVSTIDWVGDVSQPFDTTPVRVRREFIVTGWAVDERAHAVGGDVDVDVDGTLRPAMYGLERPDVAAHFGDSAYRPSGFTAFASGGTGPHALSVRILAADRSCYYATPAIAIEVR